MEGNLAQNMSSQKQSIISQDSEGYCHPWAIAEWKVMEKCLTQRSEGETRKTETVETVMKNAIFSAGETTQRIEALDALQKELGSIPRAHMVAHNHPLL